MKMESLRDFGTYRVYGRAMKVEKWKSIESLKGIRLVDLVEMSSGLTPNSHLRELGIFVCMIKDMDDMVRRGRVSIEKMTNLVKLNLYLDTWNMESSGLHRILKLIPNLESLTSLKLKADEFTFICPAASVFPPNLSHLALAGIKDVLMEELGKLPKLQYLALNHSRVSEHFSRMKILHGGFPYLKALSLKAINLRGIDIEEGGMSCLKQLRIRNCSELETTENLPRHIIISFT